MEHENFTSLAIAKPRRLLAVLSNDSVPARSGITEAAAASAVESPLISHRKTPPLSFCSTMSDLAIAAETVGLFCTPVRDLPFLLTLGSRA